MCVLVNYGWSTKTFFFAGVEWLRVLFCLRFVADNLSMQQTTARQVCSHKTKQKAQQEERGLTYTHTSIGPFELLLLFFQKKICFLYSKIRVNFLKGNLIIFTKKLIKAILSIMMFPPPKSNKSKGRRRCMFIGRN